MEQITMFTDYDQMVKEVRGAFLRMANSFMQTGYILKHARESRLWMEKYQTFAEFTEAEFGVSGGRASRFIEVMEKYSMDGDSPQIREDFKDYGMEKLIEMKDLPDDIAREIPPEAKRDEIREIKEAVREQEEENELNRLLGTEPVISETGDILKDILLEYFSRDTGHFGTVYGLLEGIKRPEERQTILDRMPSAFFGKGFGTLIDGKLKLIINGNGIKSIRHNQSWSWAEVAKAYCEIFGNDGERCIKGVWEETYQTQFPEEQKAECAGALDEKPPEKKAEPEKKTKEQQYDEQQARIDRETKKKLEAMEDEERMNAPLPSETEPDFYELKTAPTWFEMAKNGTKQFELRKNDRHFKSGKRLLQREFANNEYTGRELWQEITCILEDYTGLEDGYCILGVRNCEPKEQESIDGQMRVLDTGGNIG